MPEGFEKLKPKTASTSEISERYRYQECDPFEDFIGFIENGERKPPTREERERMDRNLVDLGKIFEGSDIRWHIDGALNISLMKGEYIGVHKDVDISIEQDDLEKINKHLERKGYGFFLSYLKNPKEPRGKKIIMERVTPKRFLEAELEHLMLAAIDEQGKIRKGKALNFIDVHLIKRNKAGRPMGWCRVELPEKWFRPYPISYQGQEIHLSHPAKIAYFKLHWSRKYDRSDLRALAETKKLTLNDMTEIEQIFEQEVIKGKILLNKVADKIHPDMTANQIFEIFKKEPGITITWEQISETLKTLAQKIEESDKSKEEILRLIFETFDIESMRKRIIELKSWVSDAIKQKKFRKDSES